MSRGDAYVDAAIAQGIDPATLSHIEVAASLAAQPATIRAAGVSAAAIIYGTVTSLQFTHSSTVAQVAIKSVYKGALTPRATVNVALGCVVQPNAASDGLVFACLPTSPVFLPGESVLMLLHPETFAATWGAQLGTQAFPVIKGHIRPNDPGEPLERQTVGLSVTEMVNRLST